MIGKDTNHRKYNYTENPKKFYEILEFGRDVRDLLILRLKAYEWTPGSTLTYSWSQSEESVFERQRHFFYFHDLVLLIFSKHKTTCCEFKRI